MKYVTSLLLVGFLSTACGDDGLSDSFQPKEPENNDEFGDPLPIRPGDTFWYMFSRSYRRSTGAGAGGLTVGEKQSSGHMCLEVSSVKDTETPEHKDAAESIVNARVKIVGGASGGDIAIDDQDVGTPDGAVIDSACDALWLQHLTVPSRGHGYLNPKEHPFTTRQAPVPGNQELAHLPFFDVRTSTDWNWGGWDRINDDCASLYPTQEDCPDTCRWDSSGGGCMNKATNYLNGILAWYISEFDSAYYVDSNRFYEKHPFNANCDGYTDLTSCQSAQCTWDFMANGGAGACIVLYTLDVRWRHEVTTGGEELRGPVIHSLRFEYNENGALRAGKELIAPDPHSAAPDSSDLVNFTGCYDEEPCATASFELDDRTWAEAYCTF